MASNQNQTSIRTIFGALFLALWLAALDQTVVSTALPTMVGDLGGLCYLSLVVPAYLPTSTVARPLYGKFGHLYGPKHVLPVAIAGLLVGGFLVDHLSWRWIFYISLPTGILAMAVIAAVLPARSTRRRHAVDYTGAILLTAALSAAILFTGLGGTTLPWGSPIMLALAAAAIAATLAFIAVELRSREPILPMNLFANRNFAVASGVGLIVGLSLFGAVTFLPIYLQVVKAVSPTTSGLLLMPMMLGMLATSVISGRIISRVGRYNLFPILGTATMTFGLVALSLLALESHDWQTAIDALCLV